MPERLLVDLSSGPAGPSPLRLLLRINRRYSATMTKASAFSDPGKVYGSFWFRAADLRKAGGYLPLVGINIFDPSDNIILSVRNAIDRRTYYETSFSLSATTNISLMIKAYDAHYKPIIYKLTDINSPTLVTTNANHTLTAHWK